MNEPQTERLLTAIEKIAETLVEINKGLSVEVSFVDVDYNISEQTELISDRLEALKNFQIGK